MKKKMMLLIVIIMLFITSCNFFEADMEVDNKYNSEMIHVGFSMSTLQEERWLRDRDEFVAEIERLGAIVTVMSPDNDANLQIQQIESLILQKVDVLVVVPYDADSLSEILSKAKESGIKVISYDRLIRNFDVDYYISFDNKKVGVYEAKAVLDVVDSGKFAYVGGSLTDNNAILLKEGTMSILNSKIDSGEIELIYDEYTENWNPDIAYNGIKKYLDENDADIDGIICGNDGTAFGAITALKEYGLEGKVPVSGQDSELSACRLIAEGHQTSTVYKSIKLIGSEAAKLAVKVAKGESVEIDGYINNGYGDIPSILLEPILVTKDNLIDVIVNDDFHSYDDVYINIPESERPPRP